MDKGLDKGATQLRIEGQCRDGGLVPALKGRALDEEPRVKASCNMGVGCEEAGVCYATAAGAPDRCGMPEAGVSEAFEREERDTLRQQRDRLAGLLREVSDEWRTRQPEHLLERIDAALAEVNK